MRRKVEFSRVFSCQRRTVSCEYAIHAREAGRWYEVAAEKKAFPDEATLKRIREKLGPPNRSVLKATNGHRRTTNPTHPFD
jgi:hypothetical protein